MDNFRIYKTPEMVARAAADYLFQKIKACVAEKGSCHVILPGGSTPARCLELLAEKALPWKNIHWYAGDERCYPVGHAERNDTMITAKLLSQHEQASCNFHPIPAELGPELAAENYASLIDATGGVDIAVLGMGEDGHTASLFPGNKALDDQRSVVAVYNAPKAPAERVSIGLTTLRSAAECIVIATGANKAEALASVLNGALLPVGIIEPDVWFIDEAAASIMT
ncbi:MAG: 6-phosphogluconolactonase [Gammaproteobacteria bacterium]|nr:6-phosphogluconolactonase [Gammaproteobacteria bacterium]